MLHGKTHEDQHTIPALSGLSQGEITDDANFWYRYFIPSGNTHIGGILSLSPLARGDKLYS